MSNVISNQGRVVGNQAQVSARRDLTQFLSSFPQTGIWSLSPNRESLIINLNPYWYTAQTAPRAEPPSYANWGTYQANREWQQRQQASSAVPNDYFYSLFAASLPQWNMFQYYY